MMMMIIKLYLNSVAVQHQNNYGFAAVACDHTTEQTANRHSQTKGGLIGFTMNCCVSTQMAPLAI